MPNWCENRLTVEGSVADVTKFREEAKPADNENDLSWKTDLSLNKLYPVPEDEADNAYHWCIAHWGTKWDVEAGLDCDDEGYLEYTFDSAWSPPVAWLEEVSKKFPTLDFRLKYDDPANGFLGIAKAKAGIVRDDALSYY